MATPINSGYASEILNVTINNSSFVPVTFTKVPNNVLISSRNSLAVLVALSASGTPYFTIPAGQSMTYDWNMGSAEGQLFLKGTGADVAEIVVTYEG